MKKQKSSQKQSKVTLHRNHSFLVNASSQILIINCKRQVKAVKDEIRSALTPDIKYLKFRECFIGSFSAFFDFLRIFGADHQYRLAKISIQSCQFDERSSSRGIRKISKNNKQLLKANSGYFTISVPVGILNNVKQIILVENELYEVPPLFKYQHQLPSLELLNVSRNLISCMGKQTSRLLEMCLSLKNISIYSNPLTTIYPTIIKNSLARINFEFTKLFKFILDNKAVENQIDLSKQELSIKQLCQILVRNTEKQTIDTQIKDLIEDDGQYYLDSMINIVVTNHSESKSIQWIFKGLLHCYRTHKFTLIPHFLNHISNSGKIPFQKLFLYQLLSLNPLYFPQESQYLKDPYLSFKILIRFLESIQLDQNFPIIEKSLKQFILSAKFRHFINSIINNQKDLQLLIISAKNKGALGVLVTERILKFLEGYGFENQTILAYIVGLDNWKIIQYYCSFPNNNFCVELFDNRDWKKYIKASSYCFKLFKKLHKKYVQNKIHKQTSIRQDPRPCQILIGSFFRNEISTDPILKQYEEFQQSLDEKSFSRISKYPKKSNKFSIAKQISESIKKKQKNEGQENLIRRSNEKKIYPRLSSKEPPILTRKIKIVLRKQLVLSPNFKQTSVNKSKRSLRKGLEIMGQDNSNFQLSKNCLINHELGVTKSSTPNLYVATENKWNKALSLSTIS